MTAKRNKTTTPSAPVASWGINIPRPAESPDADLPEFAEDIAREGEVIEVIPGITMQGFEVVFSDNSRLIVYAESSQPTPDGWVQQIELNRHTIAYKTMRQMVRTGKFARMPRRGR